MRSLPGVHHRLRLVPVLWTVGVGIALSGIWSLPEVVAEETPVKQKSESETPKAPPEPAATEQPVQAEPAKPAEEEKPPEQVQGAQPDAQTPKAMLKNNFWRAIFGFGDEEEEEENGSKKRSKSDPRAPFNSKMTTLFKKAMTHFKAGETRQSLDVLQKLLEAPEDSLYETAPGKLISIRSAAHRLLAQMPGADLEQYRSENSAAAKRQLQQAQAIGSATALAQVANRYFQTDSGFEAANLLVNRHLDRGEYGLAAYWLRELLESHAPVTRTLAWRTKAEFVANKIESATLKALLAKQPPVDGKTILGGEQVNRVEWLAKIAKPEGIMTPALQDWPQFFGSSKRVGQVADGEPLLMPRWSYPLTFSLAIHEKLTQLDADLRDEDQTPIFTFNPLLVDGKIVFRSYRGVKVLTADTGQVLWETSDDPAVEDVLSASSTDSAESASEGGRNAFFPNRRITMFQQQELEEVPASDNPLTHLLYRNANHGLLSSDGQRLFVIEDLSVMTNLQPGQYWGEDLPEEDLLGRPLGINRLAAYDLQSGRSLWEVGGASLNDPFELPLAGSFFFGVPVVDGGDLYVVAEKEGQIRLHALDAATGQPRWSQLIAYSQAKISMDVGRQWFSAPVAVGSGVIVCPTTVGWIVAIDRGTRGILWAYRYQNLASESESEPQDEAVQPAELNERWSAAPPVIVGDRVIFTPPEESRIICLSLSDGQEVWSQPRNSALYLAGVFGEEAVIVSESSIRWMNILHPDQRHTLKFKSTDAHPAGRGVAVRDHYYLPLTNGELLAINLKTHKLEGTSFLPSSNQTEQSQFGNLAMYRGMLLSLNPHGLVAFEPKLSIESELQQQLTQNPRSATAAIRKAELELLHRHYPQALDVLRQIEVSEVTAQLRPRYRAALVTTLSALVREDLGARDNEFEELARLVELPVELQSREMLRAERLRHRKDYAGAFQVYAQFAATHGAETLTMPGPVPWKVRGEQWAAGQIEELLREAPPDAQSALGELVQSAATAVLAQGREHQQAFLNLFGAHRATAAVRKQLVETLVQAQEWQAAENLLTDLEQDSAHSAWAIDRLARLWNQAGFPADAAHFYQLLERRYAANSWQEGKTVAQYLEELRGAGKMPAAVAQPVCDWHNRELEVTRAGCNFDGGGIVKDFNRQGAGLPFFQQHRLQFVPHDPRFEFEIVDARTEKKFWSQPLRTPPEHRSGLVQANLTGHQVVLFQGGSVTAVSPTERRILWSHTMESHSVDDELETATADFRTPTALRSLVGIPGLMGGDSGIGDNWGTFTSEGASRLANQHYACYLSRRQLVVLDARTGRVIWQREGTPLGARLIGGPRVIYLWHPAQDAVTAYRAIDGRELTIPKLAALGKKALGRAGDDFIRAEKTLADGPGRAAGLKLERFDPVAQTVRWSIELPRKTLGTTLSGDRLVLVNPKGQLQLCDLHTGTLTPAGTLPASALRAGHEVYAIPTYDQLLVVAHQNSRFANDRYGNVFPSVRVAGTVHSFDLATGKEQWKQSVSGLHLVLERLDHSPAVLFLARTFEQNGSSWKLSLLAIDRHKGQILHQSESQVQADFHQMSVNMKDEFIELRSYNDRLRLTPKSK